MKYIVREHGLALGGSEYANPDDAIDAAADLEQYTGVSYDIYIRWQHDVPGMEVDTYSGPHTAEARELAAAYRREDMSDLERSFNLFH